jgi:hypothetical protein
MNMTCCGLTNLAMSSGAILRVGNVIHGVTYNFQCREFRQTEKPIPQLVEAA